MSVYPLPESRRGSMRRRTRKVLRMKTLYANTEIKIADRRRAAGAPTIVAGVKRRLALVVLAMVWPALLACGEQAPPPVETVRAIRSFEVGDPAEGQKRRFSGVVEAADNSSISFEVAGNVHEVHVDVGQKVENGQVLAVMDDRTFREWWTGPL